MMMDDAQKRYAEVSIKTADNLRTIAQSLAEHDLSRLSLPEVDAVVDQVARMIPAGNVPSMILSGLARLPERKLSKKTVRRDINLLFKGVAQTLDTALYGTFFAGPAAVIWGYQNLLKLSGKDLGEAFPEGSWQFYVDYALREDTARHANETHGFDTYLNWQQIRLNAVDRITAWVMAAIHGLHQYDALLANAWRERVYTQLLTEVTRSEPDAARYTDLYRDWERQRPYGCGADAVANEIYPTYRRRQFDQFLVEAMRNLRADLRARWARRVREAEAQDLPAYQRQMSILAYLAPGPHGETRTPIPLKKVHVGVIHQGRYYLIAACSPGTDRLADAQTVRAEVAALLAGSSSQPARLTPLAEIRRSAWPGLRRDMSQTLVKQLDMLRLAPILINYDARPSRLPLSELRRAERGVGDHALTLFDTGATMVFDQSHIFFDGAWGASLAEIMTQEAQTWAHHLNTLEALPPQPGHKRPHLLTFSIPASDLALIQQTSSITPETSAETEIVDVRAILKLRQLFKQRSDELKLTVNDLLILYRAIHAVTYQPDPDLVMELRHLTGESATRPAALAALEAIDSNNQDNPAIVIPVDASLRSPRERLYPITFEVPLDDLDLLNLHEQVMAALHTYKRSGGDRHSTYAKFDQLQRTYLATLAGFGLVLRRAKEIASMGESLSVSTIKLLGHLPTPLQRMLEKIPDRLDMLNDIIRGREVFSNVGIVTSTSTLTRFISAKDDNEQKTLAWGVITDTQGVMRITLRDFRPHVGLLTAIGRKDLAARLTQHYLDTYAHGLNDYIRDLQLITQT